MRNLRPLELVIRTRKSERLKERLTAPVKAYTAAELREKFPAGFTRAHTKLEREILQLRREVRRQLPPWKMLPNDVSKIAEEKLERQAKKYECKVNSPARVIAKQMFVSMEKDVYPVPFEWLQQECLKDPMFKAKGTFRAVYARMLHVKLLRSVPLTSHEEAMKTKLKERPWAVLWTEQGRSKFQRIRRIVQGAVTEEEVQRSLEKARRYRDFMREKRTAASLEMQRRQDELVEQQTSLWSSVVRRVSRLFRWRATA